MAAESGRRRRQRASLTRALAERQAEPVLPAGAVEWSASFDLPDWQDFARYLTRTLGGDLATTTGKAAFAVIATAPVDEEDGVLLNTMLGPVSLGWSIDDQDTIDAYIHGPSQVRDLCDQWFDSPDTVAPEPP